MPLIAAVCLHSLLHSKLHSILKDGALRSLRSVKGFACLERLVEFDRVTATDVLINYIPYRTGLRVTATNVLINYIPYRTGVRVTATDVLINYIPYRVQA